MYRIPIMPASATALWGLSISDADFAKLKAGLEPMDQDDKWRYAATDDSESGTVTIRITTNCQDGLFGIKILERPQIYFLV
ncbi:hypothetical protein EsH8_II_000588 [Colletotrichum jinshuiense]